MSRDIKFRIWYYETKEVEYPPTDDVLDPVVIGLNGLIYQVEGEDLVNDTAKSLRQATHRGQVLLKRHKGEWSQELAEGVELMQYTGLKDKNGKEIYEGDIVTFEDFKWQVGWYGIVAGFTLFTAFSGTEATHTFSSGVPIRNFGFISSKNESGYITKGYNKETGNVSDIAVIGNIHENPELIGK